MPPSLALIRGENVEQPDDVALVASVIQGDRDCAAAFHRRVWPVVLKTLRRLFSQQSLDVEDLAMDTVEQLVLSIDRFRAESSLDRWVSKVTAHVAYRHLRRKRLESRLFVSLAGDSDEDGAEREPLQPRAPESLHQTVATRQALAKVRWHLEQISEEKATCFVLHDVHGYSLEEVAEVVGVSISSAQTRLSRGRRELHERLSEDPSVASFLDTLGELS